MASSPLRGLLFWDIFLPYHFEENTPIALIFKYFLDNQVSKQPNPLLGRV